MSDLGRLIETSSRGMKSWLFLAVGSTHFAFATTMLSRWKPYLLLRQGPIIRSAGRWSTAKIRGQLTKPEFLLKCLQPDGHSMFGLREEIPQGKRRTDCDSQIGVFWTVKTLGTVMLRRSHGTADRDHKPRCLGRRRTIPHMHPIWSSEIGQRSDRSVQVPNSVWVAPPNDVLAQADLSCGPSLSRAPVTGLGRKTLIFVPEWTSLSTSM
jgi:hypothetical protein